MTKKKAFDPYAITLVFTPHIRHDGDIVRIRIKQNDATVYLTMEQAKSLIGQLQIRVAKA